MNFAHNMSYATLEKIVSSGFKFLILYLVATALGPAGQGEYSFLLTFWSTSFVFCTFGLEMANTFYASNRNDALHRLLGNSLMLAGLMSLIPIFGMLLVNRHSGYFDELYQTLPLLPAGLVITFYHCTLKGSLYGRSEYKVVFHASLIQHLIVLAGLLICTISDTMTIFRVTSLWLAGATCSVVILLVRHLLLTGFRIGLDTGLIRDAAVYGSSVYPTLILNAMNHRLDVFLILYYLDLTQLGAYILAVVFIEVIHYIPNAATRPIMTEAGSEGIVDDNILRNISGITLLITLLVAVAAPVCILVLFPQFPQSFGLCLILLPGGYFLGMSHVMCFYLFGLNRGKVAARCSLAACVVTLTGNLLLLPRLGIHGAAITTFISYLVHFLMSYREVRKLGPVGITPQFDFLVALASGSRK